MEEEKEEATENESGYNGEISSFQSRVKATLQTTNTNKNTNKNTTTRQE